MAHQIENIEDKYVFQASEVSTIISFELHMKRFVYGCLTDTGNHVAEQRSL